MLPGLRPCFFAGADGGCACTPAFVTGNRTARITVSTSFAQTGGSLAGYVDGSSANNSYVTTDNTNCVNGWFQFDFGVGARIKVTAARILQQGTGTAATGTWKWQASDNGSTWTDVGGTWDLNQNVTSQTVTTMSGNTGGYRYYRMLGTAGVIRFYFINEFEFEECTCP